MKKTATKKITSARYYEIAKKLRESEEKSLDISKFCPWEVEYISLLVQSNAIFEFVGIAKDYDVRYLRAIMEFLEAEDKLRDARVKFR